jgi:SAM-dependent methyltransferase
MRLLKFSHCRFFSPRRPGCCQDKSVTTFRQAAKVAAQDETPTRMTFDEFHRQADALATRIGVRDSMHGYFTSHRTRLYETCRRFDLFQRELGDVLEVGPFYSYTPVLLRGRARSYQVLEGTDVAVAPLQPLYAEHGVAVSELELFDVFGSTPGATARLPYADGAFDTVLCWETMEHFNFNPVPFVRELWRVTRPGARLCLTVPNRASGEALFSLLTGRGQRAGVDSYFKFADYEHHGRRVFLGFHWREYTLQEFTHLFQRAGFQIADAGWMMHFQDQAALGATRKIARQLLRLLCRARPSLGKSCCLLAVKP